MTRRRYHPQPCSGDHEALMAGEDAPQRGNKYQQLARLLADLGINKPTVSQSNSNKFKL